MDKLIPYLGLQSVSELAQAYQLTAQVLQENTVTWAKLVKRSCPYYEHTGLTVEGSIGHYHNWVEERFSANQTKISHLTRILQKMENPKVPLLELLHVICERFPPVLLRPAEENGPLMAFHLSCPCKRGHSVNILGFLFLEKVEGALKSAEQEVEEVSLQVLTEPWLSALESRVLRQQRTVRKVDTSMFFLSPYSPEPMDHQMKKLFSMQQKCQKLTLRAVEIWGDFNGEGEPKRCDQDFWNNMARVLEVDNHGVKLVGATRSDLQGGRRDDLRVIIAPYADGYSSFQVDDVLGTRSSRASIHLAWNSEESKEEQWIDFQQILDTPPEQWPSRLKQQLDEDDSDSMSEDSDGF